MEVNLFGRHAALFLPASNPRAIAKARAVGADLVILDLEDAVKPSDKEAARAAAVEALAEAWPCPVAIRVNGSGTAWHDADVAAVAGSAADAVVVPKVEESGLIDVVAAGTGKPVVAMIETAYAVLHLREIIAARELAGLIAGTNDLSAQLGASLQSPRWTIALSLQAIVLAARARGVPAFDGVYNRLEDPKGFAAEAREGRLLGFDGKTVIHPSQIEPCHAAWAPTEAEVARAERLIAAASGGAERFEGEMVEQMHVEAARRLLRLRDADGGGVSSSKRQQE